MYDIAIFIPLREAAWLVGKAMFPNDWTGYELEEKPDLIKSDLRAEKARLKKARIKAFDRLNDLLTCPTDHLDDADYAKHRIHIEDAKKAVAKLKSASALLNDGSGNAVAEIGAFERRRQVECRLIAAFMDKQLVVIAGFNTVIPWSDWMLLPDFRFSFPLSLVFTPARDSNRSKRVASIPRNDFDAWMLSEFQVGAWQSARTSEEAAKLWLIDRVKRWQSGSETAPKKAQIFAELKAVVTSLSERAMERAWQECAPKEWKTSGPKAKRAK